MPDVGINVISGEHFASIPPDAYTFEDTDINHVQLPGGTIAYALSGNRKEVVLQITKKLTMKTPHLRFGITSFSK